MVDYLSALKAIEKVTEDTTPWDDRFKAIVSSSIKEQADAFKLRFALQFSKQGLDVGEVVRMVNAASDMFVEKTQGGNGKNLKYGGVEFGDVIKEFMPGQELSFLERKKRFKDFDLDNNGNVDLIEFLLFFYKKPILDGYVARFGLSGVDAIDTSTEAEALMKELASISVLVDLKVDENILKLKNLQEEYEKDMQRIKDEAKSEIKQRQLTNELNKRETQYENDQMSFMSPDKLAKSKQKLLSLQESFLKDVEAELTKAAAEALKPKKNLVLPGH